MRTIAEVAKELGVNVSYVRRLCADRRIKAVKVGRDWVVLEKNIKKILASK